MNDREKAIEERKKNHPNMPKEMLKHFPYSGDKLRYRGDPIHWFAEMIENAEKELRVGEIYTLKHIELFRSWCLITLEETGGLEYCLGFFDIFSESEQKFVRHL